MYPTAHRNELAGTAVKQRLEQTRPFLASLTFHHKIGIKPPNNPNMTDKTDLKREMRRNQLRNQARRKALAHVPLSNRRRYANILDQSNACYAVHETIRKEFDPTPKVIPPKE